MSWRLKKPRHGSDELLIPLLTLSQSPESSSSRISTDMSTAVEAEVPTAHRNAYSSGEYTDEKVVTVSTSGLGDHLEDQAFEEQLYDDHDV